MAVRQAPVSDAGLALLSKEQLRILRNAIFAYHRYQFRSADLAEHFAATYWYRPDPDYTEARLNATELANAQLILEEERSR